MNQQQCERRKNWKKSEMKWEIEIHENNNNDTYNVHSNTLLKCALVCFISYCHSAYISKASHPTMDLNYLSSTWFGGRSTSIYFRIWLKRMGDVFLWFELTLNKVISNDFIARRKKHTHVSWKSITNHKTDFTDREIWSMHHESLSHIRSIKKKANEAVFTNSFIPWLGSQDETVSSYYFLKW